MVKQSDHKLSIEKKLTFGSYFGVFLIAVLAIGYWGGSFANAQTEFKIAQGEYVGDGATSQSITEVGFSPDLVIIKGDYNKGHTVFHISAMPQDKTYYMAKGAKGFTGAITSLGSDGFSVGDMADVNKDGITYHWTAFDNSGTSNFRVGSYTGDDTISRQITGLGFQPDLVWLKGENKKQAVWQSTPRGANDSMRFARNAKVAITSLDSDGFSITNTDEANELNSAYYYVAFASTSGTMAVGSYTGNGTASRVITDPGFMPEWTWVKSADTNDKGWHRYNKLADFSFRFDKGAASTGKISALENLGFEVETDLNVGGDEYFWATFANPVPVSNVPTINVIHPTLGEIGDVVIVSGIDFGATQDTSFVDFNGTQVTAYLSWSDVQIVVEVPIGTTAGDVVVTTNDGASNGAAFSFLPTILGISPSTGEEGDTIIVTGTGFDTHQHGGTVTFNRIEADSYISWSATELVVVAPASTTGDVVVTTAVGTSNGIQFEYLDIPVISSISPSHGLVGSAVTTTGVHFGSAQGGSYVAFGSALAAQYPIWGDTSIVVEVPAIAEVGNSNITVITNDGTSNSVSFTVDSESSDSSRGGGGRSSSLTLGPKSLIYHARPVARDISVINENTVWKIDGLHFGTLDTIDVKFYSNDTGWLEVIIDDIDSGIFEEDDGFEERLTVRLKNPHRMVAGDYSLLITPENGRSSGLWFAFTVFDKIVFEGPTETQTEDGEDIAFGEKGPEGDSVEDEFAEHEAIPSTDNDIYDSLSSSKSSVFIRDVQQFMNMFYGFWSRGVALNIPFFDRAYSYEIIELPDNILMNTGSEELLKVVVKNVGTETWYSSGLHHVHLGTAEPHDRTSLFVKLGAWESNNRVGAYEEEVVVSGELATFMIPLQAPDEVGTYTESFGLVVENLTWHQGPIIQLTIDVV